MKRDGGQAVSDDVLLSVASINRSILQITEDERRAIVDLENRIAGGNAKTAIVTENTAKLPKDYLRFDPGYSMKPAADIVTALLWILLL